MSSTAGALGRAHRHRDDGEPAAGRRPRGGPGGAVRRGRGIEMDAFNVAFRVPNLLRDLFAEGAMTAAFVPTFTRTLDSRGRTRRGGSEIWSSTRCCRHRRPRRCSALSSPTPITPRNRSAVRGSPGQARADDALTRVMLPFLTTVAAAVAMMGMLNSLRRFFIPALSPAMFNVATIACAFGLVPLMPRVGLPPIAAIAIGTLLGGVGQVAAPVACASHGRFPLPAGRSTSATPRCGKSCA